METDPVFAHEEDIGERVSPSHGDYFITKEDCVKYTKARKEADRVFLLRGPKYRDEYITNPVYRTFRQPVFTAGNQQQFRERSRMYEEPYPCLRVEPYGTFVPENTRLNLYSSRTPASTMDTFKYLFCKFKKGIYVKIREGRVVTFLPFSNAKFINEWYDRISVAKETRVPSNKNKLHADIKSLLEKAAGITADALLAKMVAEEGESVLRSGKGINIRSRTDRVEYTKDIAKWYANNHLIRLESPISESCNEVNVMRDMIFDLCSERNVSDIDFFLNKRDYPLLTKDGTEPYEAIYGEGYPLVSHNHTSYAPILSMCTTDIHADIPIPTWDDWKRVSHDKFFPPDCSSNTHTFNTDFTSKKEICVFRGKNTGKGLTAADNPRIRAAEMSMDRVTWSQYTKGVIADDTPMLDCGITKWDARVRVSNGGELNTLSKKTPRKYGTVSFMSSEEQSTYKYVLSLDGHVSAFRLSLEMDMGVVVLKQKSKYRLWFDPLLQDGVNYVEVREDLSDLYDKLVWCRTHPKECESIARASRKLYETQLSRESILDTLQETLNSAALPMDQSYIPERSYPYLMSNLQVEKVVPPIVIEMKAYDLPTRESFDTWEGIRYAFNAGLQSVKPWDIKDGPTKTTKIVTILNKKFFAKAVEVGTKVEEYIGVQALNKLTEYVPNFSYTYGIYTEPKTKKEYLLSEIHEGKDYIIFSEFLRSEFSIQNLLDVVSQVVLALGFAQEMVAFNHNDITPWNIIIRKHVNAIKYTIPRGLRDATMVTTNYVPIIIDYDKSRVSCHKKGHVGNLHGTVYSGSRDLVILVIKLVAELLTLDLSKRKDVSIFTVNLLNFLDGMKGYSTVKTTNDAERWVTRVKNYDCLIESDLGSFSKTPIELVVYMINLAKRLVPGLRNGIKLKNKISLPLHKPRNPVLEYCFAMDNRIESKKRVILEILQRLNMCQYPEPALVNTKVRMLYFRNQILKCLNGILAQIESSFSRNDPFVGDQNKGLMEEYVKPLNRILEWYSSRSSVRFDDGLLIGASSGTTYTPYTLYDLYDTETLERVLRAMDAPQHYEYGHEILFKVSHDTWGAYGDFAPHLQDEMKETVKSLGIIYSERYDCLLEEMLITSNYLTITAVAKEVATARSCYTNDYSEIMRNRIDYFLTQSRS
jgi:hypothetical protein